MTDLERITEYFKEHKRATAPELQAALNLNYFTVMNAIDALLKKHTISFDGALGYVLEEKEQGKERGDFIYVDEDYDGLKDDDDDDDDDDDEDESPIMRRLRMHRAIFSQQMEKRRRFEEKLEAYNNSRLGFRMINFLRRLELTFEETVLDGKIYIYPYGLNFCGGRAKFGVWEEEDGDIVISDLGRTFAMFNLRFPENGKNDAYETIESLVNEFDAYIWEEAEICVHLSGVERPMSDILRLYALMECIHHIPTDDATFIRFGIRPRSVNVDEEMRLCVAALKFVVDRGVASEELIMKAVDVPSTIAQKILEWMQQMHYIGLPTGIEAKVLLTEEQFDRIFGKFLEV